MLSRLLLLFIVVPIAELALLLEIGRHLGLAATLALIVSTGVLGAFLARRQGLGVLADIRSETAAGRLPAGPLMDGALILVAGAVLMTPGVLTDAFGFLCLFPPARKRLRSYLARRFERAIETGTVRVDLRTGFARPDSPETRDVTPRPERLEGPNGNGG